MNRKLSVLLCLIFCFASASRAHAYLDPGIGTYTFQILIAGLMATIFSLGRFWHRLLGLFSKKAAHLGNRDRSGYQGSSGNSHTTQADPDTDKVHQD